MISLPPFVMFVVALGRQTCFNPIGLSAGIVFDVSVPKRRQFTGGPFRGVSGRFRTINDDLSILVWQKARREITHTVRREVDRARQVFMVVGYFGKRLDQGERIAPINFDFQLFS